jgi:thioredoxin-like negative regulator of GroEL
MNTTLNWICVALCTFVFQLTGQAQPPRPPVLDPFQVEVASPVLQGSQAEITSKEFDQDPIRPLIDSTAQTIELQTDLDTAKKIALEKSRPLFVIFGASWCSWCKKLEADLDDEAADPIFAKWIVVVLDADAEPEIASDFQVDSLPSLHLLTSSGERVASFTGYKEPTELAQWLDDNYELASPILPEILASESVPNEDDVTQLITLLATKSKTLRELTIQRLENNRPQTCFAVAQTFLEGRLVQKLAALEILRSWQAPIAAMDPWVPDTFSTDAVAELRAWAKSIE